MTTTAQPINTIDITDMSQAEVGYLFGIPVDGEIRARVRARIDAFKTIATETRAAAQESEAAASVDQP